MELSQSSSSGHGAMKEKTDSSGGSRNDNTSMMAIGTVIGVGLLGLAVLLAVIWWRRQRRPFVPVLRYVFIFLENVTNRIYSNNTCQ